jgi:hypothetical protein
VWPPTERWPELSDTFDLSVLRQAAVTEARRPAYIAWSFTLVLAVVTVVSSGIVPGVPPQSDLIGLLGLVAATLALLAVGLFFWYYPEQRLRLVSVTVTAHAAEFLLADGRIETLVWPAAAGGGPPSTPSVRLNDWTDVIGVSEFERFAILYRGAGAQLRVSPLTYGAFTTILGSMRSSGSEVREERRTAPGRAGQVRVYTA